MHTIFHSRRLTITRILDELTNDISAIHNHLSRQGTSVGRPVLNADAYILGENESSLPIESMGMMWEGGRCVSCVEPTYDDIELIDFSNEGNIKVFYRQLNIDRIS
jgi:hypothetical protein